MRRPRTESLLFALLVLAGAAAAVIGRPNADEGWYLLAGRRVFEGGLPYRDFAFTQAPLAPYAFGAVQALVPGPRLRLGRATSLAFLIAAACFASALARRLATRHADAPAGDAAAAWALFLLLASPDLLYFATLVKTYALAAALLSLAALLAWDASPRRRAWAPLPAGLAAATRLSLAPGSLVIFLIVLVRNRAAMSPPPAPPTDRAPDRDSRRISPLLPPTLAFAAGLAPLLIALAAPSAFLEQTVLFHLHDVSASGKTVVDQAREMQRMHGVFRLAVIAGIVGLARRSWRDAAWFALLIPALAAPHLLPRAHHAEYFEAALPLAAAPAGAGLALLLAGLRPRARRAASLAVALALLVAGALRLGDCYGFRDLDARARRWDPARAIELAAAAIDSLSTPGDTLLTWSSLVAVEARRPVPAGLEMGPFSLALEAARGRRLADAWGSPESFGRAMAARYPLLFWEPGGPPQEGLPPAAAPPPDFWVGAWTAYRPVRAFPGFGQWQVEATLMAAAAGATTPSAAGAATPGLGSPGVVGP